MLPESIVRQNKAQGKKVKEERVLVQYGSGRLRYEILNDYALINIDLSIVGNPGYCLNYSQLFPIISVISLT